MKTFPCKLTNHLRIARSIRIAHPLPTPPLRWDRTSIHLEMPTIWERELSKQLKIMLLNSMAIRFISQPFPPLNSSIPPWMHPVLDYVKLVFTSMNAYEENNEAPTYVEILEVMTFPFYMQETSFGTRVVVLFHISFACEMSHIGISYQGAMRLWFVSLAPAFGVNISCN